MGFLGLHEMSCMHNVRSDCGVSQRGTAASIRSLPPALHQQLSAPLTSITCARQPSPQPSCSVNPHPDFWALPSCIPYTANFTSVSHNVCFITSPSHCHLVSASLIHSMKIYIILGGGAGIELTSLICFLLRNKVTSYLLFNNYDNCLIYFIRFYSCFQ